MAFTSEELERRMEILTHQSVLAEICNYSVETIRNYHNRCLVGKVAQQEIAD